MSEEYIRDDDAPMDFYEEPEVPEMKKPVKPWKILIVDDEKDVHKVTEVVLRSFSFEGRSLEFYDTYSGLETKDFLSKAGNEDIAVILLDVVMETNNSGLEVVKYIREQLENNLTRIILRTGQPGSAPENKVITEYDINDYKEKSELTKQKLFTSITTAIRSYKYIDSIEKSRRELHKIIMAGARIFQLQSMHEFYQAVLQQFVYLLNLDNPAMQMHIRGFAANINESDINIIASIGQFSDLKNEVPGKKIPSILLSEIQAVIDSKTSQFRKKWYIAYFENRGNVNIICIEIPESIDPGALDLIELFNMDVGIAFSNLYLNKEIIDTQKELVYSLGEVVETRSKETSYHIHRVSEYVGILARKLNLDDDEIDILKTACVMHDVGKVGIPDYILLKPGKLTEVELEIMKTHTTFGAEILKATDRPIFHNAAVIALHHHEKWDGTGYPEGLKGEEIPLSARITSIVDVFDALSMNRIYRKAWPIEKICSFIEEQSGKAFEPKLVDLFIQNKEEFIQIIKGKYPIQEIY